MANIVCPNVWRRGEGAPESKERSPAVAWQHLPASVISCLLLVLKSNSTRA